MNIHEYQGKQLLQQYGIPVPEGHVASSPDEAVQAAQKIQSGAAVVKAQVHAGGRGKAGGVKLLKGGKAGGVKLLEACREYVKGLLGSYLVTHQTTEKGQLVSKVLVEAPCDIAKELYLGAVIDRATRRVVLMASTEGGVEIEQVAEETPQKIIKVMVDPLVGAQPYQCRQIGFALGLPKAVLKQFVPLVLNLYQLFITCDLSLLEINPLVITQTGSLLCLDAKINVDDNALYRQAALKDMRDTTQEEARETRAQAWDLSYIALEGTIGCMVNGAGLAMATMDLIKLHGGAPANFLDVGGSATQERVTEAFKIILSDDKVKGILVNIFGGIVRCDLIAGGIIAAIAQVGISVPVVVRLEGNNAEVGAEKLNKSALNIIAAQGLTEAAQAIVKAVSK